MIWICGSDPEALLLLVQFSIAIPRRPDPTGEYVDRIVETMHGGDGE